MLYQLSYFRIRAETIGRWVEMDSNHRRRKPADLQSAPFGHSGNFPSCLPLKDRLAFCAGLPREAFVAPLLVFRKTFVFPLLSHRLSEPMEGFEPPTS